MEINASNDLIFDNIVEQIKNKNNIWYEFKITEEKINYEFKIKHIQISFDNNKSNRFAINVNNENIVGKKIKFYINNLKIIIINQIPYFIIKDYELHDDKINIKIPKLFNNLCPNPYKIATSINELNKNNLYSLILKVKEIKIKTQQYEFQFEDSKGYPIQIEGNENFEFENGKIYYFHAYNYNSLLLKLEKTDISYIEEFSPSTFKINNSQEIFEANINSLLNLKGKVKSFNIKDQLIIIEEEDDCNKNEYKIKANYYLLKKLVLDTECKFYNFFKKNPKEFVFSNLSLIEAEEKTYIDFNFPLFDLEEKYYNRIKINNKYYNINNSNIKILIENLEENNLFRQKISYEKVSEGKVLDSYIFDLELTKGKIYNLDSSLGKHNFSYEFYIQSTKENNLPESIKIKFKEKIIEINNPDKNGNKFKERFTIINVPEQNIREIFELSETNDQIKNKDNLKYLIMIDNDNKKTLKVFEKINTEKKNKDFFVSPYLEKALEKASNQCYKNFCENNEDKLYNIDKNDIKEFEKLITELMDGFGNFKFENSKRHYKIIKDIVAFTLNYSGDLLRGNYYSFRKNYEIISDLIINLEYIDRIKILLTFFIKVIGYAKKNNNLYYDFFNLIDLDNNKSYDEYPFVKDAFDIFYTIIDDITEDCSLFQGIDQFNSIIYEDIISRKIRHSGSILNVNDTKLELVKNINRFIFLSEKNFDNCSDNGNFEPSGLLVTVNIFSFHGEQEFILDEKNYKKLTIILLLLLFHECLGHQKKYINNKNSITPRIHYDYKFQDFSDDNIDTGFALEIMLYGKPVNVKYFAVSDITEKLLDPKLYLQKNCDKLQNIYKDIEIDYLLRISLGQDNNEINLSQKDNKEKHSLKREEIKSQNIKKENINKKQHLMYRDLFQLYYGISEQEKEKLKDDENYQKFLMMNKRKHQMPSEYLKLPNMKPRKFGNKK